MKVNINGNLFDTEDILFIGQIRELHDCDHEFRFTIDFKLGRSYYYTVRQKICDENQWKKWSVEEQRIHTNEQEVLIKQIHKDLEWAWAYGHGGSRTLPITN
jgi:hypothetical protein